MVGNRLNYSRVEWSEQHFPSCCFAANLTKPASVAQFGVDTPLPSMLNDPPPPIFFSEEALLHSGVTLSPVISVMSPLPTWVQEEV